MAGPKDYLDSFALLSRDTTEEQRRSLWRQGIATLARAAIAQQPVPLEGINPDLLLRAVGTALNAGLVDELDWLSPPAAAAAIYELAAAIPESRERRELGRRVLARLNEGDAGTFVALATSLAAESRRLLTGSTMRARVALALELPAGKGVSADALALALISRPDLRREWLIDPSSGSLPSRHIAARLLQRAAGESARRAQQGDTGSLRIFQEPSVAGAWKRLLVDRESLVWRHVAVARGLLAHALPDMAEEIDRHLAADLTPTEWRRAAVSLVAGIATEPDRTLARCLRLLEDQSLRRDPGLAGAMIFGMCPAAEAEPEAAEILLDEVVRVGGLEASEALVELRREFADTPFGDRAARYARAWLEGLLNGGRIDDDGRVALCEALIQELQPLSARARPTLRDSLDLAVDAFVEKSARQAHIEARLVFHAALEMVAELEQGNEDDPEGRRNTFRALRELDVAVLETATLYDLLAVGGKGKDAGEATVSLDDLFERFTNWMLRREQKPIESSSSIRHLTLRLKRMRTLLHLVDSDGSYGEDVTGQRRERRKNTAALLLRRARDDVPSPLRRVVCAALARSCDALVRDDLYELSDVFVAVSDNVAAEHDLNTLAEASMMPDFQPLLAAYAELVRVARESKRSGRQVRAALDALERLAQSLPWTSTLRVSALRNGLLDLGRDLEVIASARSLHDLTEAAEGSIMERTGDTVSALAQITLGARWRVEESRARDLPASSEGLHMLERALRREVQESTEMFEEVVSMVAGTMRQELPPAIAETLILVLDRVRTYPADGPPVRYDSFVPPPPKEAPLPPWMPPHRTLGGFYVLRALGHGGVASVFVVKRVEEKQLEHAENFALKVPDYNAEVARTLSEEQFLTLFRDEAGALLALPSHQNLARFVTFDAGARPKPILVMELVEGPSLERVIDRGDMDMRSAFAVLDGVGAGLSRMHGAGIGHLDIKPANVILREPAMARAASKSPPATPVLVDFGLAGRHLRPGCATGPYGAPEIWGLFEDEIRNPAPMAADTYAYACLCYEVLTGGILFEAADELATISGHLSHDGDPPRLQALSGSRGLDALRDLLGNALRKHPAERIGVDELREGIAELSTGFRDHPWPLRSA